MRTNSSPILIVGGAGYIGSHMVLKLKQAGFMPIVLDNLSAGHQDAVHNAIFIHGEMDDVALLESIFNQYAIQAVMHFGAHIEVGESVRYPIKYYRNNVAATLVLLQTMLQANIKHFIFSSTAAVYGEPLYSPIDEAHPCQPINPYGMSKKMVETMLADIACSTDFHFASLRYFNAAGADPSGLIGERHAPETHLIPLLLQVANGEREHIAIYGQDYATPDGTCVRDYIHVNDICDAHLLALKYLLSGGENLICNLGTGLGYSVQEVIDAAKKVTGKPIATIQAPRRPGDSAILVADATLAHTLLNWQPQYNDLFTIVEHAWFYVMKNTICAHAT